jgi:hypothetical protein
MGAAGRATLLSMRALLNCLPHCSGDWPYSSSNAATTVQYARNLGCAGKVNLFHDFFDVFLSGFATQRTMG